jgi:ParB family chromosome partitioning protein
MAKSLAKQLEIELYEHDVKAAGMLPEEEPEKITQSMISVQDIKVMPGRRTVDKEKVKDLVKSIREIGLINPITLTSDLRLIAGAHRLQAYKDMGQSEIPVTFLNNDNSALIELAEIDENIVRNNLHFLENGQALARRKEIYEMLYPETKQGGDRRSEESKTRRAQSETASADESVTEVIPKSFVADTSSKTGHSERKIWEDIQLNDRLTDTAKNVIKEQSASKKDALQLSRMSPDKQEEAAALIDEAGSLTRAIRLVNRGSKQQLPSLEELRRQNGVATAVPEIKEEVKPQPLRLSGLIEKLDAMQKQYGDLAVKIVGDGRGREIVAVTREKTRKGEWICID